MTPEAQAWHNWKADNPNLVIVFEKAGYLGSVEKIFLAGYWSGTNDMFEIAAEAVTK